MLDIKNQILNRPQILQKIKRMSYEIYENNIDEQELIFAAVYEQGYLFAHLLHAEFQKISTIPTSLIAVHLDKFAPTQSEVNLTCGIDFVKNKTVIVIDDVLNTGRTFAYALRPFLKTEIKKLQTAVLVDRGGHKQFPVAADYAGYALSTTIRQHIQVELADVDKFGVYLY
ncbi:MAG: phosphoribosyltransferase [Cytophagales bacterium]|nr:MAG: phosphoribosyltransferase [Cytophagales bacterium]